MRTIRQAWNASPELSAVAAIMIVFAVPASVAAFLLDDRVITGAPAWLKPVKFAISTALYAFSVAWLLSFLPEHPRLRRAGSVIAAVLVIELVIIDLQAWRGTTSHFNASTPINALLATAMGVGVLAVIAASFSIIRALFAHRFEDPAVGSLLRATLVITLAGTSLTGALMGTPRSGQLRDLRHGHVSVIGAHTVGAEDGGRGIRGLGWSADHGDLRAPHFVALHALQILPLLYFVSARARAFASPARRLRLARALSASYAALVLLLIAQAMAGVPLLVACLRLFLA
jgi:hypothetical protein